MAIAHRVATKKNRNSLDLQCGGNMTNKKRSECLKGITSASTQTEEILRVYFSEKFPFWEEAMVAIAAARSFGKLEGFLDGYYLAYHHCAKKRPSPDEVKDALDRVSLYKYALKTWPENPTRTEFIEK